MIDLTKYLKNKDIKFTNEDFDLDKLEKEFNKPSDNMVSKEDYTKLQNDYASLEANYNNTVKTLSDTNDKMSRVSLESKLVRKGFDEKDFDEVVKLRNALYGDEKDDSKAIDLIADRYRETYFKTTNQANNNQSIFNKAPNESNLNGANNRDLSPLKVERNTSIKQLLVK